MMTPSSLGALRNELWIVWHGAKANCVVILSEMPVRLGPKDLSYLRDVFRICGVPRLRSG
jgi:hypothetical protein